MRVERRAGLLQPQHPHLKLRVNSGQLSLFLELSLLLPVSLPPLSLPLQPHPRLLSCSFLWVNLQCQGPVYEGV